MERTRKNQPNKIFYPLCCQSVAISIFRFSHILATNSTLGQRFSNICLEYSRKINHLDSDRKCAGKNIVVGCIYRHPSNLKSDISEFNKYLDATLSKLVKEKKEIYICGDFNIDLLRMNDFETHLEFYTLLHSHGLLPFIVQPSRVVSNQVPSLIDNIFSTNISDAVSSGNIYLTLSEHFCQFASVNCSPIDVEI